MDSPRSGEAFVPPVPQELAANFPQLEILELLGRGGMGAVYKARQRGLDRIVALKILPPEVGRDPTFAERFEREARALAKLNHPHVVTVHDVDKTKDGLYFIIMEYVDGVNLRHAIKAGSLASQDALAIVSQICDALQYAHDAGVVHRDIKPENILLDRRGQVKIADFGLAKLLGQDADASLTHTHQIMGTLRYMAPEQMEGTHHVDHRADIYSLGVLFYELLTGELPIGRFAPPSKKVHIDVRLDEVVLRALEKEPDLRYQQVSEVKTGMEAIYGQMPLHLRRALGHEYKSKTTIFGVPLVHIATGIDPATGKKRVAKGIIAIGDVAVGVIAMGGIAMGGFTLGGVSFGVFSLGGLALGLVLASGGCAVAGVFAFGGLAVGGIALGGMAVGYYAFGGGAFGVHTMSGAGVDPAAERLFMPWAMRWTWWVTLFSIATPIGCALMYGLVWLVFYRKYSREAQQERSSTIRGSRTVLKPEKPVVAQLASPPPRPWLVPVLATLNVFFAVILMFLCSYDDPTPFAEAYWRIWEQVENALGFIMSALLFIASIGLFLWKPWARKMIVVVCVYGLASLIIDMPFLTRAGLPHLATEIEDDFVAEGMEPEDAEAITFLLMVVFMGGFLAIGLTWLIGQLVYFTRPKVIAVFEAEREATL
jgi:tRNA A-37 threonylcarbamoyl transferase component Bud32/MFS family permease